MWTGFEKQPKRESLFRHAVHGWMARVGQSENPAGKRVFSPSSDGTVCEVSLGRGQVGRSFQLFKR